MKCKLCASRQHRFRMNYDLVMQKTYQSAQLGNWALGTNRHKGRGYADRHGGTDAWIAQVFLSSSFLATIPVLSWSQLQSFISRNNAPQFGNHGSSTVELLTEKWCCAQNDRHSRCTLKSQLTIEKSDVWRETIIPDTYNTMFPTHYLCISCPV